MYLTCCYQIGNIQMRQAKIVHIITRKRLAEFWQEFPDAEEPLDVWYRLAKQARWGNLAETRQMFPHADPDREPMSDTENHTTQNETP